MCYLIRQQQAEAERDAAAAPPVPMDDGVPTASDTRKAGMGACNHEL